MRRSTRLLLGLSLLSGLLVAGATATPAQAADPPVVSCEVDYVVVADWGTGHQAQVVVTNTGTVPVWWYVVIRFDPGVTALQVWNAQVTGHGSTWRFEPPPPWNTFPQSLPPGQQAWFGITVAGQAEVEDIEVFCRAA